MIFVWALCVHVCIFAMVSFLFTVVVAWLYVRLHLLLRTCLCVTVHFMHVMSGILETRPMLFISAQIVHVAVGIIHCTSSHVYLH